MRPPRNVKRFTEGPTCSQRVCKTVDTGYVQEEDEGKARRLTVDELHDTNTVILLMEVGYLKYCNSSEL